MKLNYINIIILNICNLFFVTNSTNYNTKNYKFKVMFHDSTCSNKKDSLKMDEVYKVIQHKISTHISNSKDKGILGKTLLYKK